MVQYNPSISGSLSVTGSLIVTNGVIGTVNGVDIQIFSSSISQVVTNIQTATGSQDGRLTSIESFTSSISNTNTFTSSTSARLSSIETVSASNISRLNAVETITASNIARLTSLEITTGSLATTGSNTFIGTQTITGSLFISSNLIVQGTSSLQNITASAVSIGTNLINLNTANPAIRYAGLVIGDSGSVGGSGSFLYDSVQDEMLFIHRGSSTVVTSSVTLMGPETYDSLGNETYPTSNRIQKGRGNEHLADSCIFDDGTIVCINTNLKSNSNACVTSVCSPAFVGGTVSGTTGVFSSSTTAANFISNGSQFFSYTLKGRPDDNFGAFGFYSNDGATRYGYIQTHSACGGQFVINGDGGGQITLDNRGITTTGAASFNSSLSTLGNIAINDVVSTAKLQIRCANTWGDQINESINIVNSGANGNINIQHNMGAFTWYSGNVKTAAITAWRNLPASGDFVDLAFATSTAGTQIERMRIMSSGCVGIGNTSPTTILHTTIRTCISTCGTVANSYPVATFSQCDCSGGARGLQIGVPTGGINSPVFLKVLNTGVRFSILDESNVENFTISGGRVGIRNCSPGATLHVGGTAGDTAIFICSTCKTSNPTFLRLIGVNSNDATTQMQIVHRGNHSSGGFTDRIDFSVNNGTAWCERVIRLDFNGNVGMCEGSLSIANQISIGGTGTAAAKGYKKFYSFGSGFDNPTINLISVGNPTNSVTVLKVTVYTTGFGSNTANIHTGYAMKSWVASYACPMSVVAGFGNNNVGTIAWSGETLTYTANRVSNYDSYHVEVDYGGSNGSMSASWF